MLSNNILPVSVIIINFNTKELTENAISSIYKGTFLPKEIIVVDNGSVEKGIDDLKQKFPEITLIKNIDNVGFARANNMAISNVSTQPYVWLVNSDTEIGDNTLKQLYDFMEENTDTAIVSPQLIYPNGKLQSTGGFFPSIANIFNHFIPLYKILPLNIKHQIRLMGVSGREIREKLALDYVTGAALFLRKSVVAQVGLLGDDYFMYFEETDLCWRVKNMGFKIYAINTSPVMHIHGASFKNKYDIKRLRLFNQSLARFILNNYKGLKKAIMLIEVYILGEFSIIVKSILRRKG